MRPLATPASQRSREIVDIIGDVVKATASGCTLMVPKGHGKFQSIDCPEIHYVFGNGQYVKDNLDELSKTAKGNEIKFPLIALFCPVNEKRGTFERQNIFSSAKLRILIACSSSKDWSNEEREEYSFENILRPIYRKFLAALGDDSRLEVDVEVPHEYSENYTYGRYGAYTGAGEEVSEPIDAINISNLEIKVKLANCRRV